MLTQLRIVPTAHRLTVGIAATWRDCIGGNAVGASRVDAYVEEVRATGHYASILQYLCDRPPAISCMHAAAYILLVNEQRI